MSTSKATTKYFLRLTRNQRIQHVILMISTGLLIITGFMLQADRWLIESFGSAGEAVFWWRGWIHRAAGVVVTVLCVYHLLYVIFNKEGKSWFNDMLPKFKDFTDALQNIKYMLRLRNEKPKMGRFMYLEKLEYWSVYFGMLIVISTGIMMWTEYLWPHFYFEIADTLHLAEATLAALAIIVGHIFGIVYNPYIDSVKTAFVDGMVAEELMKEEHRLWYEQETGEKHSDDIEADRDA